MPWPIPKYSKNQVSKAGLTIVDFNLDLEDPKDLDQLLKAFEVISNWRLCHGYIINTFQANLRKKVKPIDDIAIVAQRLKRMTSIVRKLRRYKNMKLSTMQDIGGLRAVVSTLKKVRNVQQDFTSSRFHHELVTCTDYISSPKASGYRSVHLVYRFKNPVQPQYNSLLIEIQLRTRIQHAFATAVETMDTFLNTSLKSSEGPTEWLNFFSLIGSAFAHLEDTLPIPGYENITKKETFKAVRQKAQKLKIRDSLLTFTIATERVKHDSKKGNYHLIVLHYELKTVNVKTYRQDELELANQDYTTIEQQIQKGEPFQAVLVSAGSIKNLRSAYPNYFLDTREFLKQLARIEKQAI